MRKLFLKDIKEKKKPWGREIWFAWTSQYAGKILEIKKGHRFSLQVHEKKWETQLLMSGKLRFTYGKSVKKLKTKILLPGFKIDVPAGLIHRAQALQDSVIFEVSSPELDDVIKLSDDYGRTGRGNNEKLDQKLSAKKS